jgi:hypothetical protein
MADLYVKKDGTQEDVEDALEPWFKIITFITINKTKRKEKTLT